MPDDIDTENVTDTPEVDVEETTEQPVGESAEPTDDEQEPETFPRDYVEKLRKENATYRERAKRADDLAQRLHAELVRSTGRLADPSDLQFDAAHLEDADAIGVAIDDLLARKPHLAARRVIGDIGQGASRSAETVNLAGILRERAG